MLLRKVTSVFRLGIFGSNSVFVAKIDQKRQLCAVNAEMPRTSWTFLPVVVSRFDLNRLKCKYLIYLQVCAIEYTGYSNWYIGSALLCSLVETALYWHLRAGEVGTQRFTGTCMRGLLNRAVLKMTYFYTLVDTQKNTPHLFLRFVLVSNESNSSYYGPLTFICCPDRVVVL